MRDRIPQQVARLVGIVLDGCLQMLPLGVPIAASVGVSGEQEMRAGRQGSDCEGFVEVGVGLIGVLRE